MTGRPRRVSGYSQIASAQERYLHSLDSSDEPDFHAIALAIGSQPSSKSNWGYKACIDQAPDFEALFDQTGDFRHVVEAIGLSPKNPPHWAIEACMEEVTRIEVESPSTTRVHKVLDAMASVFLEHHFSDDGSSKLPLHTAIKAALEKNDEDADDFHTMYRSIERAWNREQDEDVVESHIEINGYNFTGRMRRVAQNEALEGEGLPTNLARAFWRAENKPDQKPDQK